jgi:NTP pyrophosphatase (non-canonical NTP hydrolase)
MSGDFNTHNNQQPNINYTDHTVDLSKYALFVDGVTSDPSKDYQSFIKSLSALDGEGSNIHRLLTAAVGISAEGGEFMEIVKKMVFQGKPWDDHNREHLVIELGDVMWYVMQACMALNITLDDVIAGNVEKLKKRYPGGEFDVYKSENRAVDDL